MTRRFRWSPVRLLVCAALLVGASACQKTISTSVTQPRPKLGSPEELPRSQLLFIDVKDMDFPSTFKLRQSAHFVVKNRKFLRFHIQLVHKWEEVADPRSWDMTLIDDKGRQIKPASVELDENDTWNSRAWEIEQRNADRMGNLLDEKGEHAWQRRLPLQSVGVFKSRGDVLFRAPELFRSDLKSLTLVMKREDLEYRFIWRFHDGEFHGAPPGDASVATSDESR